MAEGGGTERPLQTGLGADEQAHEPPSSFARPAHHTQSFVFMLFLCIGIISSDS